MTNSPIIQNDYDLRHLSEEEVKSVLLVISNACESLSDSGYQICINIHCLSDEETVE
jgi:hypothetical protein